MFRKRTRIPDEVKSDLAWLERRLSILSAVSRHYGGVRSPAMIVAITSTLTGDMRGVSLYNATHGIMRGVSLYNATHGIDQYGGEEGSHLRKRYIKVSNDLRALRSKHMGRRVGSEDEARMDKTLNHLRVVYYNDGLNLVDVPDDLFDGVASRILAEHPYG